MWILIQWLSLKIVLGWVWSAMHGMRHYTLMEGLHRNTDKIRAIDDECPTIARELLTTRDMSCCFANLNLMDWRSGNRSDASRINPTVDEVVITNIEVIDSRGVAVKLSHFP